MPGVMRKFSRRRVAVAAAFGAAGSLFGLINPADPNVTLYERPPKTASAPRTSDDALPELKQDAAGYWQVDFRYLASFSFGRHKVSYDQGFKPYGGRKLALLVPDESEAVEMPTEPGQSGTIPNNIVALDGQRVCLTGYMLPIKLEDGLVKDFLVLRNQMMCCYGRRPELNEWVVVKMKGKGVPSTMDTPLKFYGTLHVGEFFNNHVFEGLYQLDGEKTAAP